MDKQFRVVVENVPTPDAEERLRKVFDMLLRLIPDGDEETYTVDSHQVHLATDDTPNVATPPKTGLYKTPNRHYNK